MMKNLITSIIVLAFAMPFSTAIAKKKNTDNAQKTTKNVVDVTSICVAIIDFESKAPGNPDLGSQIGDILTARLSIYDQFTLVERQKLKDVLDEQKINLSGMVNPNDATRIGKMLGARIMIFGRAFPVDKKLYLVAKIVSTETSKVKGVMVKGGLEDEISDLMDDLVEKLATGLEEWAPELLPEEEKYVNKIKWLKNKLKDKKLPTVAVVIPESHINRTIADPAAETEIIKVLKEIGFTVKNASTHNQAQWVRDFMKDSTKPIPSDISGVDILIAGEAISEYGANISGLTSCAARVEIKAVSRKNNEIIVSQRTTRRAVDLSEAIAAKTALQASGHELAIKIAEQLHKTLAGKKSLK